MDIARTQGDINGLNAAKKELGPLKENATEKERQTYVDRLRNSNAYKEEMKKSGTGSALQQVLSAATAAQEGKTAAENNNLAVIRTGAAACAEIPSCSKAVVNIGLGALVGVGVATSAMEDLSGSQKTNIMLAAMSGDLTPGTPSPDNNILHLSQNHTSSSSSPISVYESPHQYISSIYNR